MSRRAPPSWIPNGRLDAGGWTLVDETTDTVFELPTATVEGHTLLYEDEALRHRVVDAGGDDRTWRFFFVTRLRFRPPLASGVSPLVKPTVVSAAKRRFGDDLRDRGIRDVDRGRTETIRTDSNARARLTRYRGRLHVDESDLSVVGYLSVWYDDCFYVTGGAYPESGLDRWVDGDATRYRDELFDLIRAVG